MSKPPEDRNPELRAIFFESANELLQSLNEAGLELEARPSDEEVIRRVRRAVHTLKGDSAACGFQKLSEFAHELEDILTTQVGQKYGSRFAEVVLAAADSFEAMLSSYQRGKRLPSLEKMHGLIRGLLVDTAPTPVAEVPQIPVAVPAAFAWTEYEQLMISEAVHRGETVYNVALRIDPDSMMRAAAFQLIRNVLHSCGTLIALRPEDNLAAAQQRGLIRYTAAGPILVLADVAHNGGQRQLRRQLLHFLLISIDEGRTLQQVLRKVAANTKLGENSQVRSPLLGAFRQGKNACSIARKIADGGIELRQRNFHVGSLGYVRRPALANCAAIFIAVTRSEIQKGS